MKNMSFARSAFLSLLLASAAFGHGLKFKPSLGDLPLEKIRAEVYPDGINYLFSSAVAPRRVELGTQSYSVTWGDAKGANKHLVIVTAPSESQSILKDVARAYADDEKQMQDEWKKLNEEYSVTEPTDATTRQTLGELLKYLDSHVKVLSRRAENPKLNSEGRAQLSIPLYLLYDYESVRKMLMVAQLEARGRMGWVEVEP